MRGIRKFFLYWKYYFEPNDKMVRGLAYKAAKEYYAIRPLRSPKNPYPRVVEYNRRREDFLAFQRAYNSSYRHQYSVQKLEEVLKNQAKN